ncbi:hypothetical protein Emed_004839 [Eimeria media]
MKRKSRGFSNCCLFHLTLGTTSPGLAASQESKGLEGLQLQHPQQQEQQQQQQEQQQQRETQQRQERMVSLAAACIVSPENDSSKTSPSHYLSFFKLKPPY